ncbi:HU family DNA-binding protein [Halomonas maura]|uniref:HU family DNA-binding protein n=1 Tax=Halomonas maura TaxID=117606 RepID=UPI0025B475C1|nr:HU family DNA-binding protein [Halomonas maura]MDN3555899.1 HU family DNA-binding protein [Halomonas maura]
MASRVAGTLVSRVASGRHPHVAPQAACEWGSHGFPVKNNEPVGSPVAHRNQEGCMRKPELAAAIAERADLSKDKASQVLNVILDEITGSVSDGKDVSLIGFGTFTVRERAARTGKNPQTGQPLTIPASKTVAFKPGKGLKDAVAK